MSYIQLVEPNLDPYIHVDGAVLTDWYGWCLAYVRTAFNTPFAGSNAWQGWQSYADGKHADRNLPGGVFVPIWFSGYSDLGHCAIYKDGQVWTSPWHHKPTADVLPSIEEVERIYGVTYAGWSEGLGGVAVIGVAGPPYTIESITPKQIRLNKDTHLWNLGYDNFTAIESNPIADAVSGTVLTVTAQLNHNIGYSYFLANPSIPNGYNILDCDDYTPPPPPEPTPAPLTSLPSAPLTAPSSDTFDTVKDLTGYQTSNMAINHISSKLEVTIPAGTYFVYNRRFDDNDSTKLLSVNLTKTPGIPGAWVNVTDNSLTPPPEPVVEQKVEVAVAPPEPDFASTYKSLPEPQTYVAMSDIPVIDLSGSRKSLVMPKYSITKVAGFFSYKGESYARPNSAAAKDVWYGIPVIDPYTRLANLELETKIFSTRTTIADRRVTKTLKPLDHFLLGLARAKKIYLGFSSLFSKLKSAQKNKK